MQTLVTIPEQQFKGMDTTNKPEYLKPGYCVLAQNCLLGNQKIETGPGAIRSFSSGTNKPCLGGIATSNRIYATFNDAGNVFANVFRWTGSGSAAAVSSANLTINKNTEFVDTGTGVYVMNGTDACGKIVDATWSNPAGIPIGKYGAWFNNRLYIAGNTTYPNRLYYSDANTPDTFQGSSYIDIIPSDRSQITGLTSHAGVLVIGKLDQIVTFEGFTSDDFTVKSFTEQMPNFGVTSHRSFVNTGNDLLFMSFAGDVPHIRSMKRTAFNKLNYGGTISQDIEGTMRTINYGRLDQVAGGFDGRYAWWSVPRNTSTTNDMLICYDTFSEAWTVHPGHCANVLFRSVITGDDRLYYGTSESSGKVLYLSQSASSIDGEDINFQYITKAYRPHTERKAKWKYMYMLVDSATTGSIRVEYSPDGYSYQEVDTVDPKPTSSVFSITFDSKFGETDTRPRRVNLIGSPSYTYQVKLSAVQQSETVGAFPFTFPITFGQDTSITIKEFSLLYYPRQFRDAR